MQPENHFSTPLTLSDYYKLLDFIRKYSPDLGGTEISETALDTLISCLPSEYCREVIKQSVDRIGNDDVFKVNVSKLEVATLAAAAAVNREGLELSDQLFLAVQSFEKNKVEQLLQQGVSPLAICNGSNTPLLAGLRCMASDVLRNRNSENTADIVNMMLSKINETQMLNFLSRVKSNPEEDQDFLTPAIYLPTEIITQLLDLGVPGWVTPTEINNEEDVTILLYFQSLAELSFEQFSSVLNILIKKGLNIKQSMGLNKEEEEEEYRTLLSLVVGHTTDACPQKVEKVKFLIDQGADVNAKDSDGDTPLHWAAADGHVDVVKLLIDCRADVNAKNSDGDTPLHLAVENSRNEIAYHLLVNGAKTTIQNNQRETAYSLLAENNNRLKEIEKFIFHTYLYKNIPYLCATAMMGSLTVAILVSPVFFIPLVVGMLNKLTVAGLAVMAAVMLNVLYTECKSGTWWERGTEYQPQPQLAPS